MFDGGVETTRVGMSIRPDRVDAAVVQGSAVHAIPAQPGGDQSIARALARASEAATAAGAAPATVVTMDVSGLVHDALVRATTPLARIAAIRVVPRASDDPVLGRALTTTVERLVARRYTVPGGHDLRGDELRPLDLDRLAEVCADLTGTGVDGVGIVGSGSQRRPEHERAVAEAVQAAVPGAAITLASEFGGQGFHPREATVLIDCALAGYVNSVLERCERALARSARGAVLRVARSDGGSSLPWQVRLHPSVTLGASYALQLSAAAHLDGLPDCRVRLRTQEGPVVGEVRSALPVIRPGELRGDGTEVVVPMAQLAPDTGQPDTRDGGARRVVDPDRDAAELTCVGAAISRPTSWLDEIVFIQSTRELEDVRREAERRAIAMVAANSSTPGGQFRVDLTAVAIPYSVPGTVRIWGRVVAA